MLMVMLIFHMSKKNILFLNDNDNDDEIWNFFYSETLFLGVYNIEKGKDQKNQKSRQVWLIQYPFSHPLLDENAWMRKRKI